MVSVLFSRALANTLAASSYFWRWRFSKPALSACGEAVSVVSAIAIIVCIIFFLVVIMSIDSYSDECHIVHLEVVALPFGDGLLYGVELFADG